MCIRVVRLRLTLLLICIDSARLLHIRNVLTSMFLRNASQSLRCSMCIRVRICLRCIIMVRRRARLCLLLSLLGTPFIRALLRTRVIL